MAKKCPACNSTNTTSDKWVVGDGNTMKNKGGYGWYCGNCGNLFK